MTAEAALVDNANSERLLLLVYLDTTHSQPLEGQGLIASPHPSPPAAFLPKLAPRFQQGAPIN